MTILCTWHILYFFSKANKNIPSFHFLIRTFYCKESPHCISIVFLWGGGGEGDCLAIFLYIFVFIIVIIIIVIINMTRWRNTCIFIKKLRKDFRRRCTCTLNIQYAEECLNSTVEGVKQSVISAVRLGLVQSFVVTINSSPRTM